MDKNDIQIGQKFYVFDYNHRVYKNGSGSGPDYRSHFVEREILGETARSWIVGYPGQTRITRESFKVPKNNPFNGKLHTEAMVEDAVWANEHRYKIREKVQYCSVEQLKKIAEVLGYKT